MPPLNKIKQPEKTLAAKTLDRCWVWEFEDHYLLSWSSVGENFKSLALVDPVTLQKNGTLAFPLIARHTSKP